MAIEITENQMTAVLDGTVIASAVRTAGTWTTTGYTTPLTHNQAITALSIAKRLTMGHDESDPFVRAWREELARD